MRRRRPTRSPRETRRWPSGSCRWPGRRCAFPTSAAAVGCRLRRCWRRLRTGAAEPATRRMIVETMLQLDDRAGAIKAMLRYREDQARRPQGSGRGHPAHRALPRRHRHTRTGGWSVDDRIRLPVATWSTSPGSPTSPTRCARVRGAHGAAVRGAIEGRAGDMEMLEHSAEAQSARSRRACSHAIRAARAVLDAQQRRVRWRLEMLEVEPGAGRSDRDARRRGRPGRAHRPTHRVVRPGGQPRRFTARCCSRRHSSLINYASQLMSFGQPENTETDRDRRASTNARVPRRMVHLHADRRGAPRRGEVREGPPDDAQRHLQPVGESHGRARESKRPPRGRSTRPTNPRCRLRPRHQGDHECPAGRPP